MAVRFDESRPYLKGFSTYYEREIETQLAGLEGHRKTAVRNAIAILVIAFVLALGSILYVWDIYRADVFGINKYVFSDLTYLLLLVLAPILIAAGGVGLARRTVEAIRGEIKTFLLEKVCAFFELHCGGDSSRFPLARFQGLGLVREADHTTTEDYITGHYNGISIELVEADLKDRRTGMTGAVAGLATFVLTPVGGLLLAFTGVAPPETVFHGLLCQFTFARRVRGRIVVSGDSGWSGDGFTSDDRVYLEDPRFEETFTVYATDQVEARYVLTPTLMERLLTLYQEEIGHLRLLCEEDRLLVSLRDHRNRFEGGSVLVPANDPQRTAEMLSEISIALEIVDTMDVRLRLRS